MKLSKYTNTNASVKARMPFSLGALQAFFGWELRLSDVFYQPGSKDGAWDRVTDSSILR